MTKKYYLVEAKCGHVGKGKYIVKDFPVKALSKSNAAQIVRQKPRVKHDQKDAILNVIEIDYDTFVELLIEHNNDPYMNCKSIQDQRISCGTIMDDIRFEVRFNKNTFDYDKYERRERIAYKKQKMKEKYDIGLYY